MGMGNICLSSRNSSQSDKFFVNGEKVSFKSDFVKTFKSYKNLTPVVISSKSKSQSFLQHTHGPHRVHEPTVSWPYVPIWCIGHQTGM
jgi:hypothetical protein